MSFSVEKVAYLTIRSFTSNNTWAYFVIYRRECKCAGVLPASEGAPEQVFLMTTNMTGLVMGHCKVLWGLAQLNLVALDPYFQSGFQHRYNDIYFSFSSSVSL